LEISIIGIWKEGRMVDALTSRYESETGRERMDPKRIEVLPKNVTALTVTDFDMAQLALLADMMSEMCNLQTVDLHFRYHDEVGDMESDVDSVMSTDFLAGHDSIEHVRFSGDGMGLHSPHVKSVDLTTLARLPNLKYLAAVDLYNLRWLDLSPLSRSRTVESFVFSVWRSLPTLLLRRIDLSGLNRCHKLAKLVLYGSCLDELDLSPLDGSSSLENLSINDVNMHVQENWDEYISMDSRDIVATPVDSEEKMLELRIPRCEYLKVLVIEEHTRTTCGERPMTSKFREIDLTNLEYSEQLRMLELVGQGIFHIDLSPLQNNGALSYIRLRNNDNLTEIDVSPVLPLAFRLRGCYFDKYVKHTVFDESSKHSRDVLGPPIRYRASQEMEPYYDEAFRSKFVDLLPVPGVRTLVPHPIDIEWY
jgi:hypothetical protein